MKINNNLNNKKATLKEQAQNIYNSIAKFNALDENLLYRISSAILNEANQGERELNIYLRKMPTGYMGNDDFGNSSIIVIDLDKYPTTTMKEVYEQLVEWLKTQGFLPQDVSFWCSENQNKNEPIIGTVTVKW